MDYAEPTDDGGPRADCIDANLASSVDDATDLKQTCTPRASNEHIWTEEKIQQLHELWVAKPHLSEAKIGRRLGVSKGSIASKVRRIGLPTRGRLPHMSRESNRYTQEREALLRELWPIESIHATEIKLKLNALPGDRISSKPMYEWARKLGLHRGRIITQRTPERAEIIRQLWPTHALPEEIEKRVNALPGPKMSYRAIRGWASKLKLRRPHDIQSCISQAKEAIKAPTNLRPPPPRIQKRSPEREALLRELWPTLQLAEKIASQLNALPGPEISAKHIRNWASELKLLRPKCFQSYVANARQGVSFHKKSIYAASKPRALGQFVRPPESEVQAQIAAHISAHGITQCPEAAVWTTSAMIPDEAKAAIIQHREKRYEAIEKLARKMKQGPANHFRGRKL